jgi:membrane fusion protein
MLRSMASPLALFRQEALDYQRHYSQWGNPALVQPPSTKIAAWLILVAVALAVTFLFLGQFSRKETVQGYLTPAAGTAKIFAPQQGAIKEIYVKEGQAVEKGQPLLLVDTNQIAENNQDINAGILSVLKTQQNLLTSQITAEQERMKSEQARLTAVTSGLETQISKLHDQIDVQAQGVRVANEMVSAVAELEARHIISTPEYKNRQLTAFEQIQKFQSLNEQLAARQNELTENRYSLQELPTITAGKIQGLRNELASTEQRIAEISGRRAYVIRAPAAGHVSAVLVTVGQFADPHRQQLEILPDDSPLRAELFVPTKAIGFVRPGQRVRILYDAFPYQQFGTYGGQVTEVSQTILTQSATSGPIELKEPAYRVTVALDRPDIRAYGKSIPLQAGMLLKADIILEKRSLLKWFLDPLFSFRT